MSEVKKLLGQRIKELRVANNLTQEKLGEIIDIGTTSISKIESGHTHPTPESLTKIAKAFGLEIYQLYQFNHHKAPIDVKTELHSMIDSAEDDNLKIAYKVLSAILN